MPKTRHLAELNVLLEVCLATNNSYYDMIADIRRFAANFGAEKTKEVMCSTAGSLERLGRHVVAVGYPRVTLELRTPWWRQS